MLLIKHKPAKTDRVQVTLLPIYFLLHTVRILFSTASFV